MHDYMAWWLKKQNSLTTISDEQGILSFINVVQEPYLCHKSSKENSQMGK